MAERIYYNSKTCQGYAFDDQLGHMSYDGGEFVIDATDDGVFIKEDGRKPYRSDFNHPGGYRSIEDYIAGVCDKNSVKIPIRTIKPEELKPTTDKKPLALLIPLDFRASGVRQIAYGDDKDTAKGYYTLIKKAGDTYELTIDVRQYDEKDAWKRLHGALDVTLPDGKITLTNLQFLRSDGRIIGYTASSTGGKMQLQIPVDDPFKKNLGVKALLAGLNIVERHTRSRIELSVGGETIDHDKLNDHPRCLKDTGVRVPAGITYNELLQRIETVRNYILGRLELGVDYETIISKINSHEKLFGKKDMDAPAEPAGDGKIDDLLARLTLLKSFAEGRIELDQGDKKIDHGKINSHTRCLGGTGIEAPEGITYRELLVRIDGALELVSEPGKKYDEIVEILKRESYFFGAPVTVGTDFNASDTFAKAIAATGAQRVGIHAANELYDKPVQSTFPGRTKLHNIFGITVRIPEKDADLIKLFKHFLVAADRFARKEDKTTLIVYMPHTRRDAITGAADGVDIKNFKTSGGGTTIYALSQSEHLASKYRDTITFVITDDETGRTPDDKILWLHYKILSEEGLVEPVMLDDHPELPKDLAQCRIVGRQAVCRDIKDDAADKLRVRPFGPKELKEAKALLDTLDQKLKTLGGLQKTDPRTIDYFRTHYDLLKAKYDFYSVLLGDRPGRLEEAAGLRSKFIELKKKHYSDFDEPSDRDSNDMKDALVAAQEKTTPAMPGATGSDPISQHDTASKIREIFKKYETGEIKLWGEKIQNVLVTFIRTRKPSSGPQFIKDFLIEVQLIVTIDPFPMLLKSVEAVGGVPENETSLLGALDIILKMYVDALSRKADLTKLDVQIAAEIKKKYGSAPVVFKNITLEGTNAYTIVADKIDLYAQSHAGKVYAVLATSNSEDFSECSKQMRLLAINTKIRRLGNERLDISTVSASNLPVARGSLSLIMSTANIADDALVDILGGQVEAKAVRPAQASPSDIIKKLLEETFAPDKKVEAATDAANGEIKDFNQAYAATKRMGLTHPSLSSQPSLHALSYGKRAIQAVTYEMPSRGAADLKLVIQHYVNAAIRKGKYLYVYVPNSDYNTAEEAVDEVSNAKRRVTVSRHYGYTESSTAHTITFIIAETNLIVSPDHPDWAHFVAAENEGLVEINPTLDNLGMTHPAEPKDKKGLIQTLTDYMGRIDDATKQEGLTQIVKDLAALEKDKIKPMKDSIKYDQAYVRYCYAALALLEQKIKVQNEYITSEAERLARSEREERPEAEEEAEISPPTPGETAGAAPIKSAELKLGEKNVSLYEPLSINQASITALIEKIRSAVREKLNIQCNIIVNDSDWPRFQPMLEDAIGKLAKDQKEIDKILESLNLLKNNMAPRGKVLLLLSKPKLEGDEAIAIATHYEYKDLKTGSPDRGASDATPPKPAITASELASIAKQHSIPVIEEPMVYNYQTFFSIDPSAGNDTNDALGQFIFDILSKISQPGPKKIFIVNYFDQKLDKTFYEHVKDAKDAAAKAAVGPTTFTVERDASLTFETGGLPNEIETVSTDLAHGIPMLKDSGHKVIYETKPGVRLYFIVAAPKTDIDSSQLRMNIKKAHAARYYK